jgi:hypothetical protein
MLARQAAAWAASGTPDASPHSLLRILDHVMNEVLTDGKPLARMLPYAAVCCRMLTCADVC